MDAWEITLVPFVLTLVASSQQWTSHGSIQFLSEGESTLLEAPGDSSEGCWWNLTEAWDKGNYQAIFPPDLDDGLEVSLWIFPTPDPVYQPVRENHPGLDPTFPKASSCY